MNASWRTVPFILGVVLAVACAKRQSSTMEPTAAEAPTSDFAGGDAADDPRDLEAYEQELARFGAQLRASGVELAKDTSARDDGDEATTFEEHPDAAATEGDAADRCRRICELREATCDLHDKICALADEHQGERRYAAACARADDQCQRASEACRACTA